MLKLVNKYEFYLPDRYLIGDGTATKLHNKAIVNECCKGIIIRAGQQAGGYSTKEELGYYFIDKTSVSSMKNTVVYFYTNDTLPTSVLEDIVKYIKAKLLQREVMLTINEEAYIL